MGGILTGPVAARFKAGFLHAPIKDARVKFVGCCWDENYIEEVAVTDVSTAGDFSFGTHPCGRYYVRYCRGAFYYGQGWAVGRAHTTANVPPGPSGFFISVKYQGVSGEDTATTNEPTYAVGDYSSQAVAEQNACSFVAGFDHYGGEIKLSFVDNPYYDNYIGTEGPTYRLYDANPTISCVVLRTQYVTYLGVDSFRVSFRFDNKCSAALKGSMVLQATGGIQGISPASASYSVSAGGWFDVTFDWAGNPTGNTDIVATIKEYDLCGNYVKDHVADMSPAMTAAFEGRYYNGGYSAYCGFRVYQVVFLVTNAGNFCTTANMVITCTPTGAGGEAMFDAPHYCNTTASESKTMGVTFLPAQSRSVIFYVKVPSGVAESIFRIDFSDGPVTHPSARVSVTW